MFITTFVFQILDAQRRLKGNLDDGIAVTESVSALLATKDQLPQLGTDAVSIAMIDCSIPLRMYSLSSPLSPPSLPLPIPPSLLSGLHGLEADQD